MSNDTDANGSSESNPIDSVWESDTNDHSVTSDNAQDSGEQLYKIREILFGEQMAAQNQRFEQLESRISKDFSTLRDDLTRHIKAVEDRLLHRVDSAVRQIETERNHREESVEGLRTQLEADTRNIHQRLDNLDNRLGERVTSVYQDLHAEIAQQTQSLRQEVDHQIQTIDETLSQESTERKVNAHTERANLSALFADLSQQLQPSQGDSGNGESAT